jgi:hypothetical protein
MNVISASRRTDIPAWYGSWFMERIKAGRAAYRNPFGGTLHEVSLKPEDVTALIFWTKNAGPFLSRVEELVGRGYATGFLYTLTGYGSLLEPGIPAPRKGVKSFLALSDLLGPERVRWRYDPIVYGRGFEKDFHLRRFADLAARLEGRTHVCHISFVQFYKKTIRRFTELEQSRGVALTDPEDEVKIELARELKALGASRGIRVVSCCYPLLAGAGVEAGRCVDPDWIASMRPDRKDLALKSKPTRESCGCVESRDIGAYDSCLGGCVYCYATQKPETAQRKFDGHDPRARTLD